MNFALIKEALRKYFFDKHEVVAIYLFGSIAEGKARPGSDIDIGVLFDDKLSIEERFDKRLTFIIHLEDLLQSKVDVIDLLASSLAFQPPAAKGEKSHTSQGQPTGPVTEASIYCAFSVTNLYICN